MTRNILFSVLALSIFAASLQAASSAPASETYSHPLLNQIYEMHSLAEAGNKDATRRLVAWLEELTSEQPDNGILLVYLGSAYTLASRDAFIGPGKLRFLMAGRDCMDRAVTMRPDDANVRFIRAINNYHLPTIFNRRSIARDDFRQLVDQLSKNPEVVDSLTSLAIYYYA
ncbi:MAG: hypothetical protein ACKODZ_07850, partial [Verrucomicrobiota bacterium]